MKFDMSCFRKFVQKIQVYLNTDMKTFSHLRNYLVKLSSEWEVFQRNVVEKIKTHILCSISFFFPKIAHFMTKCRKIQQNQRGADNMTHALCIMNKATRAQAQVRTHARASTHTDTKKHKHLILIALPRRNLFRERAPVLRYTYIAYVAPDSTA
jgi:hypothetical protein